MGQHTMVKLEDYALLSDTHCAALVSRHGSVDWLCLPRFDADACFAALLGGPERGAWQVGPCAAVQKVERHYREGTVILESEVECREGRIRLIDFMPLRARESRLVRIVEGLEGEVRVQSRLAARFGYGASVPWHQHEGEFVQALAGPDALCIRANTELCVQDEAVSASPLVRPGQRVTFDLAWFPSNESPPAALPPDEALAACEQHWTSWSRNCTYQGPHRELVLRSLITLKALTYAPTGAIAAAPTTSLPERLGGVRNWDYRYCWLRDATLTLLALMDGGFHAEAHAFRDWLVRAVAGDPQDIQVMYGIAGERRLTELELPWLCGYENSGPVRIGNAAAGQFQLDVFGEVMDCLHQARQFDASSQRRLWELQLALIDHTARHWREPDAGIWETRGDPQHFTHSKVMAWVAVDRAIRSARRFELPAPLEAWCKLRDAIHADVCQRGYDRQKASFTRAYGSPSVDASLLRLPLVGFLPAHDPRIVGTVAAIEQELLHEGFVRRYDTNAASDGLPPGEGAFLACSFWLAKTYLLCGRRAEAEQMFERLLGVANDVGLLSEGYDPVRRRLVGNFPQAFSHLALVDTAFDLYSRADLAARSRDSRAGD